MNRKVYLQAVGVVAGFLGIGAFDCMLFIYFPTVAVYLTMALSTLIGTLSGVGYYLIYGEHGK